MAINGSQRCGIGLLAVVLCGLAAGQDSGRPADRDPVQVLAQIQEAQARMLAEFDRIPNIHYVSETKEVNRLNPPGQAGEVVRRTYKKSGEFFSDSEEKSGEPIPIPGVPLSRPTRPIAYGLNSKYRFILDRPRGGDGWVLKQFLPQDQVAEALAKTKDRPVKEDRPRLARAEVALHFQEYYGGPLLVDQLKSGNVKIDKVEPLDARYLKLFVTADRLTAAKGENWLVLDRANGYCISEQQMTERLDWAGAQAKIYTQYTYAEGQTPPLLRSGVELIEVSKGPEKVYAVEQTRTIEVKSQKPIPEIEFSLTAFGLPEPEGVTFRRPKPVYVWLLVAAGGLVVLALLFRWLARRRRPAPGVT